MAHYFHNLQKLRFIKSYKHMLFDIREGMGVGRNLLEVWDKFSMIF